MQTLHDAVDAPGAVGRLGSLPCSLAISLWLLTSCGIFAAHAHGDADHNHGAPAAATAGSLPRLVTKSEAYELVAILDGERLTIYLDRHDDNAPVSDATIAVTIDGETMTAEPAADNTFAVASRRFGGGGSVELIFDIKAPAGDDLLIGSLMLPNRRRSSGSRRRDGTRRRDPWSPTSAKQTLACGGGPATRASPH